MVTTRQCLEAARWSLSQAHRQADEERINAEYNIINGRVTPIAKAIEMTATIKSLLLQLDHLLGFEDV